jgi:hypothetical protein
MNCPVGKAANPCCRTRAGPCRRHPAPGSPSDPQEDRSAATRRSSSTPRNRAQQGHADHAGGHVGVGAGRRDLQQGPFPGHGRIHVEHAQRPLVGQADRCREHRSAPSKSSAPDRSIWCSNSSSRLASVWRSTVMAMAGPGASGVPGNAPGRTHASPPRVGTSVPGPLVGCRRARPQNGPPGPAGARTPVDPAQGCGAGSTVIRCARPLIPGFVVGPALRLGAATNRAVAQGTARLGCGFRAASRQRPRQRVGWSLHATVSLGRACRLDEARA